MKIIVLLIISFLLLVNCGPSARDRGAENDIPQVTVSVLPQKFFVQQIASDRLDVHVMIPPGHSPATYEPTPQQMQLLSKSKIYFRIGHIPFEMAWMDRLISLNRDMAVVDTSQGVDLIHGTDHRHEGETGHSAADGHTHGGIDPHIWLSPLAVKKQLTSMYRAIRDLLPEDEPFIDGNYQRVIKRVDDLHKRIKTRLAAVSGRKFLVFHPTWTYFARDYGLSQLAIEIEGKSPNPADMKKIIDLARQEGIKRIFVQQQFDTHSAEVIAREINGTIVSLDPLAEDWFNNLSAVTDVFLKELSENREKGPKN